MKVSAAAIVLGVLPSVFGWGNGGRSQNCGLNMPTSSGKHGSYDKQDPMLAIQVTLNGVPQTTYTAGTVYTVSVTSVGTQKKWTGFMAGANTSDGKTTYQAGNVATSDPNSKSVTCSPESKHITQSNESGRTQLTFTWTAPIYNVGEVAVQAAIYRGMKGDNGLITALLKAAPGVPSPTGAPTLATTAAAAATTAAAAATTAAAAATTAGAGAGETTAPAPTAAPVPSAPCNVVAAVLTSSTGRFIKSFTPASSPVGVVAQSAATKFGGYVLLSGQNNNAGAKVSGASVSIDIRQSGSDIPSIAMVDKEAPYALFPVNTADLFPCVAYDLTVTVTMDGQTCTGLRQKFDIDNSKCEINPEELVSGDNAAATGTGSGTASSGNNSSLLAGATIGGVFAGIALVAVGMTIYKKRQDLVAAKMLLEAKKNQSPSKRPLPALPVHAQV